jgi:hypothetical protein
MNMTLPAGWKAPSKQASGWRASQKHGIEIEETLWTNQIEKGLFRRKDSSLVFETWLVKHKGLT